MLPQNKVTSLSKEYIARNESINIRDAPLRDIEEVVMSCCLLVGIEKQEHIPTGISMGIITNFIIENLGSYTSREFILAFNHVASGKIEIPKEREHFYTFSPKYLGYVMRSYSNYLARSNLSVYESIEEVTYTAEQMKEMNNKARFSIGAFVINHLIDQNIPELSPIESCYDLLRDCNLLEEQTVRERLDLYSSFRNKYIKGLKKLTPTEKESFKSFVNEGTKNEHFHNIIKEVKAYLYRAWVLNNKGINLDIFKKEFKKKINELIKQNS